MKTQYHIALALMAVACSSPVATEKETEMPQNVTVEAQDSSEVAQDEEKAIPVGPVSDPDRISRFADGRIHRTSMNDGKRNGYVKLYHPDSVTLEACSFYRDDTLLWSSYPWELNTYILPVKDLSTVRDCVEIRIPYVNGALMYKGWLSNKHRKEEHPRRYRSAIGIHTVFYPNGKVQAIVDYDKDSIIAYNADGSLFMNTDFRNWPMKMK